MSHSGVLPPWLVLDPLLRGWLLEDIGRGDRTTNTLLLQDLTLGSAKWISIASGIIAGLPLAARVFQILNEKVISENPQLKLHRKNQKIKNLLPNRNKNRTYATVTRDGVCAFTKYPKTKR